MKYITSLDNPEIKKVASLQDSADRKKYNQLVVEGLRATTTCIEYGWKPVMVYATQKMLPEVQKSVSEEFITSISYAVLKKISSTVTPSGVLAVFPLPKAPEPSLLTAGLVLANISDPGNMGTLIRTAAALNIKSVVIIDGADVWGPKVIQATAGAIGPVTIFNWSWEELLTYKNNFKLIALVVSGGKKPNEISLKNSLLVVGNEAQGIPQDWLKDCDASLTLPMPGGTESLNAAIAGSIALYVTTYHDLVK